MSHLNSMVTDYVGNVVFTVLFMENIWGLARENFRTK